MRKVTQLNRCSGSRPSPSGPPVALLPAEESTLGGLAIGPSDLVVYASVTEDSNLYTIGWPVPGDPLRLTEGKRNFRPAFSSDGRYLAYANVDVGQGFSVWLTPTAGGPGEPLLPGRPASAPQWSADGRRILVRDGSNGGPTFAWVDVATRRATPLALDGRGKAELRLSPDGRTAAFHEIGANGVLDLWVETLDTGVRRQLTHDAEAISYGSWRGDGRQLAAEVKRGSSTHIVTVDVDTGTVTQLTNVNGQSWPNGWSPDGAWIVFAGERQAVWNVWAVSTRTRETRQLTRFSSSAGYVRWPTWSPTGHMIAFERNQSRGTIWTTTLP